MGHGCRGACKIKSCKDISAEFRKGLFDYYYTLDGHQKVRIYYKNFRYKMVQIINDVIL